MISFSTIPYAEARDRARRQDRIVLFGLIGVAFILMLALVALLTILF
jgi:hypothetical protein